MPPRDIILATHNPDKVVEIRAALSDIPIRLLTLEVFPQAPHVVEDGETLEANAVKKACAIHEHTGLPALADDTGLMVAALKGEPGVYSSRYAGPNASYDDNRRKLLAAMEGVTEREAEFCAVMAFAHASGVQVVQGSCVGTIATTPRGRGRFGYDPIFIVEGTGKTFAEMHLTEKNRVSHRGRALRAMRQALMLWLAGRPMTA
jgi:XTP/dITP diphosphohydrolase